jgi:hypothetical protein
MADIKTASRISPTLFGRDAYRFGYHFQAAFYMDGARLVHDETIDQFYIIAVEKEPPFLVKIYEVEQADLDLGRSQRDWILSKVAEAEKTGQWPGYDAKVSPLPLPSYAGTEVVV